jgi:hypothetical protein
VGRYIQFLALYALMGFFGFVGTTGMLSASVSGCVVWDGGLPFSRICEVGSIQETRDRFFYSFFLVV